MTTVNEARDRTLAEAIETIRKWEAIKGNLKEEHMTEHALSEKRGKDLADEIYWKFCGFVPFTDARDAIKKSLIDLIHLASDEAAAKARLSEAEWWILNPMGSDTNHSDDQWCQCRNCKRLAHLRAEAEE